MKLAEEDLKLRGPGELYGVKQHGHFGTKIADFSDLSNVENARDAANSLLNRDPTLKSFPLLQQKVSQYTIQSISED